MIKVYRGLDGGTFITEGEQVWRCGSLSFDAIFQSEDAHGLLQQVIADSQPVLDSSWVSDRWAPPIESQEVWASGVTYFRSREARMEESESAGGDVFYDKVYEAERPELFFKATPARTRGHGDSIRVREDSTWDVPEPELTLAISSRGQVFGYTIGDDVSSRSIEGENPLYLPQAKVYKGSCSLGPALCVGEAPSKDARIQLTIERDGATGFDGGTTLSQLKRSFDELAAFLFRENEFPHGCWLMTGTGIVPGTDFTLQLGDKVKIAIDGLGVLENVVGP